MQLQTEGANANFLQTAFHYGKGGHFFCHKQNGLALGQSIGDKRGNRLGFARSRRSMEHKTFPGRCMLNGVQLGGIRWNRQQNTFFIHLLVGEQRLWVPL